MQVNNGLIAERVGTSLNSAIQSDRQARPEQLGRVESPQRRSSNGSTEIDQAAIEQRGKQVEENRVQRLNDIESAPLRTQQALDSYQQTELAAQQYEFGELVGVDLFA